ncbi:hypothetical protein [Roseobacter sp. SK209-2-6]|uniref:hypothetical protein n=1 Tax=Roseobacter sp. SK209-2-6 TaxID=388739 RepID=UPI0003089177|nr:hypothetical protein [Roseobacter sp. SK209-2-6]
MRKKTSFRGIEEEALDKLRELREVEQRFVGAILSDAISQYWMDVFEEEECNDTVQ